MNKQSEFGKLGKTDFLNALYFFLGSFLLNLFGLFAIGVMPTWGQLLSVFGTSMTAGLLSIFNNFSRNSKGQYFKKENKTL